MPHLSCSVTVRGLASCFKLWKMVFSLIYSTAAENDSMIYSYTYRLSPQKRVWISYSVLRAKLKAKWDRWRVELDVEGCGARILDHFSVGVYYKPNNYNSFPLGHSKSTTCFSSPWFVSACHMTSISTCIWYKVYHFNFGNFLLTSSET